MISEDLGIQLENVTLDMLGKAKKVTITTDDIAIVDGEKATIETRVSLLSPPRPTTLNRVRRSAALAE